MERRYWIASMVGAAIGAGFAIAEFSKPAMTAGDYGILAVSVAAAIFGGAHVAMFVVYLADLLLKRRYHNLP
jgi:phosphate/sulfate permease